QCHAQRHRFRRPPLPHAVDLRRPGPRLPDRSGPLTEVIMPEQLQTDTQPSLTSLVAGIITDVQQLIRQELALAKSEVKQEWDKTKTAAVSFGASAVVGVLGVIHISLMLVFLVKWVSLPDNQPEAGLPLWAC